MGPQAGLRVLVWALRQRPGCQAEPQHGCGRCQRRPHDMAGVVGSKSVSDTQQSEGPTQEPHL